MLRSIKRIISDESGYSKEFTERNFAVSKYVDETGRKLPCYLLTRDGFVALAMGFTGKKPDAFKEQYIKLFNEMEQQILTLQSLRDQHPLLTEAIKATRDDAQPYDYSDEADMMNRIVLGMTAKQYREQHGIPQNDRIRPHMRKDEADLMERLQIMDVGLQYFTPDFQERKRKLEWFANWWREEKKKLPAA